jgi:VanZ like protein
MMRPIPFGSQPRRSTFFDQIVAFFSRSRYIFVAPATDFSCKLIARKLDTMPSEMISVKRFWPTKLVLLGCVLILVVDFPWGTLQNHAHWARVTRLPFSGPVKPFDIVGNIALGVPLGIGAGQRFRRAALAAAMIALPVALIGEATQVYAHYRFPSATDVACNVIGAVTAATAIARWRTHEAVE